MIQPSFTGKYLPPEHLGFDRIPELCTHKVETYRNADGMVKEFDAEKGKPLIWVDDRAGALIVHGGRAVRVVLEKRT